MLLCVLVGTQPIGTNLGLVHLLWRVVRGWPERPGGGHAGAVWSGGARVP
jgi:hypothetical protein